MAAAAAALGQGGAGSLLLLLVVHTGRAPMGRRGAGALHRRKNTPLHNSPVMNLILCK